LDVLIFKADEITTGGGINAKRRSGTLENSRMKKKQEFKGKEEMKKKIAE
jgi:hypothetical protein